MRQANSQSPSQLFELVFALWRFRPSCADRRISLSRRGRLQHRHQNPTFRSRSRSVAFRLTSVKSRNGGDRPVPIQRHRVRENPDPKMVAVAAHNGYRARKEFTDGGGYALAKYGNVRNRLDRRGGLPGELSNTAGRSRKCPTRVWLMDFRAR